MLVEVVATVLRAHFEYPILGKSQEGNIAPERCLDEMLSRGDPMVRAVISRVMGRLFLLILI